MPRPNKTATSSSSSIRRTQRVPYIKPINKSATECFLCGECYTNGFKLQCEHEMHTECLINSIYAEYRGSYAKLPKCCMLGQYGRRCNHTIDVDVLESLISTESDPDTTAESKEGLKLMIKRINQSRQPSFVACPRENCFDGNIKSSADTEGYLTCQCGERYCSECTVTLSLHQGRRCNELTQNCMDEETKITLQTNTKPCPSCNTHIERSEGCPHMLCTRCDYTFCYLCGGSYYAGHMADVHGHKPPTDPTTLIVNMPDGRITTTTTIPTYLPTDVINNLLINTPGVTRVTAMVRDTTTGQLYQQTGWLMPSQTYRNLQINANV